MTHWWDKYSKDKQADGAGAVGTVHSHEAHKVLPMIYLNPMVKQKLDAYIAECSVEVSGLGTARQVGRDFVVDDIFLLKQECSGGSTDIDDEAAAVFLCDAINAGHDPTRLRVWWHSHCNFDCFWSGTDEGTIDVLSGGAWLISIVGNKSRNYRGRLDIYSPLRLTLDELKMHVVLQHSAKVVDAAKAELEAKVTVKQWKTGAGRGYGYHV